MEERINKYIQGLYNDYINYGIVREFEICDSANKRTDICIWFWEGKVYISTGMYFLSRSQDEVYKNESNQLPLFVFETSDADKIDRILYVCKNSDYLEKLERLLSLTMEERTFTMQLVDNR